MRSRAQPLVLAILVLAAACSKAKRNDPTDNANPSSAGGGAPFETGTLYGTPQPPPGEGAFDDGNQLEGGEDPSAIAYRRLIASLMRAEISGTRRGAFLDSFRAASDADKTHMRLAAAAALEDKELIAWIESSPDLVRSALWLSTTITPPDVAAAENERSEAKVTMYTGWERHAYQLIIVPGYTPLDQREAVPGVHPIARARLEEAVRAYREGQAPFIMVSGGNVYPPGTPCYEGIEMKRALLGMGIPEDVILVEARARHSTTNLRNAGRYMLTHGMVRALVTPPGGGIGGSRVFDQSFYFSNPEMSTFHSRCERELGYRVGDLQEVGPGRVAFTPSREVQRQSYRDPLDP